MQPVWGISREKVGHKCSDIRGCEKCLQFQDRSAFSKYNCVNSGINTKTLPYTVKLYFEKLILKI